MYRKAFAGKGLYDARVGYIGGETKQPSYRGVCSGTTGREFALLLSRLRNGSGMVADLRRCRGAAGHL